MLIKGVNVIDGTGEKPYKADIFISGDKISAVGNLAGRQAGRVIDGLGLYAAPGFVNINTDSDHLLSLFSHPEQESFIEQGITTIIGGQCGVSLAPLLYGDLNLLRMWTDPYQINVGWNSTRELLRILEKKKMGVNFGTLTGYATIRQDVVGDGSRDASGRELAIMQYMAKTSLRDGSFGISFGLGYYFGARTPYAELRLLATMAAAEEGMCTIHLRDETHNLVSSVTEAIRLAEESGCRMCISHFRPVVGFIREYEEAYHLLVDAQKRGTPIYFDAFPLRSSRIPIASFFPESFRGETIPGMMSALSSMRTTIKKELSRHSRAIGATLIVHAPRNEHITGKTVKEFSDSRELSVSDGMIELMMLTNLQAVLLVPHLNMKQIVRSFSHPHAIIATNSASMRNEDDTTGEHTVSAAFRELDAFPLEKIVARLTSLPATVFGIAHRGRIEQGAFADIVLFSLGEKSSSAINVRHVILNGQHVVRAGERISDAPRAGRVLIRRKGD